jgi:hypothetical protein
VAFCRLVMGCHVHFPDFISSLFNIGLTWHVLGYAILVHIFNSAYHALDVISFGSHDVMKIPTFFTWFLMHPSFGW